MKYLKPKNLTEALSMLGDNRGKARVIAGGTDLMIKLRTAGDEAGPSALIDLSAITALRGFALEGAYLFIGANVTHAQAAASELIRREAGALAQACAKVGGPQIRNVATVAGNIVSAQPATDAAVALAALDARCQITNCEGREREIPLAEMYAGLGRSAVDSAFEILTSIRIPVSSNGRTVSGYQRLERRKALSLPVLAVASKLSLDDEGLISQAAISVAPAGSGPGRAGETERWLIGRRPTPEILAQAGQACASEISFRSSPVRGSGDYRRKVLPILVARGLAEIAAQISGKM